VGLLSVTAVAQAVIVIPTGSVALLGDTLHNVTDALTAVPLAIAFVIGRRPANRRYTYGYGRAEDLAGLVIVAFIAVSAAFAGYQAVDRLRHPRDVNHLWAVAVAGILGFIGNEVVAQYRIRVGRRIGSAALVADGVHARTDGLTSLAVLVGAVGVALGWDSADPVIGLVIVVAILSVLRQAAREVYRRLMDSVDPQLVQSAEQVLVGTPGVVRVSEVRLRWIGHRLRAECCVDVDPDLSVVQAHAVTEDCEHRLVHALGKVSGATVHADPAADGHFDHHPLLRHHRKDLAGAPRQDEPHHPTTTGAS
jgi:cation diffusion facilitator family transporter